MIIISKYKNEISELCEAHHVEALYAFGSVLGDAFSESSDIDLLIQFAPIDLMGYFDNYMDLKEKLQDLFHRNIDLVENQSIRNPIFRKVIEREKQLVYERKSA